MAERIETKFGNYWQGLHDGEIIKFKVNQLGHEVTEDEADRLLAGDVITLDCVSKAGKDYQAEGHLQKDEFNGHEYWGFKAKFMDGYHE